MNGDPQGGRHAEPADDALSQRVARLEHDLSALRSEMASVQAELAVLDAGTSTALNVALTGPVQGTERISNAVAGLADAPRSALPSALPVVPPRRHDTLETRFGAAILSKVAVVLLLLGAAWFLKWAFDNRWIGPAGRVAAGLAAGVVVNLWAERFRRQQLAGFSYALKAVGSGVLYLTLWASVQLYHLAPAVAVFAAMAGVTLWNAVAAWKQDSQLLAGYALLGAYLTPLLLSDGGDHEIFLFSYLLVLALALLGWLRVQRWSPLLPGGLAATAAIFIAWYVNFFEAEKAALTTSFALTLWAVFAVVPLFAIDTAAETARAAASTDARGTGLVIAGVVTPLANGVFGALAIYSILSDSGGRLWEPWWAVGFTVAYFALSRIKREPSVVAAVHLGLAVAFFTAAIPLKLTGRSILLCWMVEAVILIAVSRLQTLNTNATAVLRALGSAILLMATGGVLLQPWLFSRASSDLLNADFLTSLCAVVALVLVLVMLERRRSGVSFTAFLAAGCLVLLNVVLLVAMHRELNLWIVLDESAAAGGTPFQINFAFSAWMMVQGAVMLAAGFWRKAALARWTGLVLLAATLVKLFALDMRHLGTGYRVVSYLGLGVLLMAVSYAYQKDWLGLLALNADHEGRPGSGEAQA